MVTRERQLYFRLVKFYVNGIELSAQLVRRLAVDLLCDRRDRFVVGRDVIGIQASGRRRPPVRFADRVDSKMSILATRNRRRRPA